ncbi:hypothetical protein M0Q50_08105 [bacterium]|nr:hypothetical protein [bacterium]
MKNGIGILLCYDKKEDFTEEAIETNNYGVHDTWTIIKANNIVEAINDFYNSYEGAKIGGESLKDKALQIDRGRRIVKIPYCNLMERDSKNRFICGSNAMFGDCVIGGIADIPDGSCAMKKFCHIGAHNFSKRLPKGYIFKKIIVGNVVYRFADIKT